MEIAIHRLASSQKSMDLKLVHKRQQLEQAKSEVKFIEDELAGMEEEHRSIGRVLDRLKEQ